MRHSITRPALAALAAASLAGALMPSFAVAQPLGDPSYRSGGYYDPCRQEKRDKAVAGAVIGGVIGAVVGSQVSGHGARTEGSLVGGGVGALGGAAVGSGSANCANGASSYYDYNNGYRSDDWRDRSAYDGDYDYGDRASVVDDRPTSTEDCQLADSVIYMPDGRTQRRFVRVCRDRSGQFQVVE